MVPLNYARSRNIQTAVDQTADFLVKTVRAFEQTTQLLKINEKFESEKEAKAVNEAIKACQFCCTGNLTWRYDHPTKTI